ncbi:MAG TPA: HAD-IIA family hydrolase [Acidimicrobiia bacterium]|nr:HAD-IIA family hydrolase [Acidimicrobiia bacterium]
MTILCDLDGVIYRGAVAVPGVPAALERLKTANRAVFFITNNSTRTAEETAEKISRLTGAEISGDQVLTSGMAAMTLLVPGDGPVLVVGEDGLRSEVSRAGFEMTDDPSSAGAVVVGLLRSLTYDVIRDAMLAVRNGARFIATNDDSTFPTEHGLAPGCGAIVAAIAASAESAPEVAGKPNRPMRDLIRSRVDGEVWVIGDRLDTDIAMAAVEPGWRSVLVLTGITSRIEAEDGQDVDLVANDFAEAVDLVLRHPQPS